MLLFCGTHHVSRYIANSSASRCTVRSAYTTYARKSDRLNSGVRAPQRRPTSVHLYFSSSECAATTSSLSLRMIVNEWSPWNSCPPSVSWRQKAAKPKLTLLLHDTKGTQAKGMWGTGKCIASSICSQHNVKTSPLWKETASLSLMRGWGCFYISGFRGCEQTDSMKGHVSPWLLPQSPRLQSGRKSINSMWNYQTRFCSADSVLSKVSSRANFWFGVGSWPGSRS